MGLRDGLMKLLSRGEPTEPDPDAWCDLITVPQFEAPLLAQRLEVAGIESMQRESLDLPSRTLSNVTVSVRAGDLRAAQDATAS